MLKNIFKPKTDMKDMFYTRNSSFIMADGRIKRPDTEKLSKRMSQIGNKKLMSKLSQWNQGCRNGLTEEVILK